MKLNQIADHLGCRLIGDGDAEITAVAGLDSAGPGDLTFLSNPRYRGRLTSTRAAAVIIDREVPGLDVAQLISGNTYLDFARALELFYQAPVPPAEIHPTAVVAESAV
ncbi:MAG TPA: LpxD N-terminal domain-containing protein, partial [Bryobacterales bacterium]|nr:LpxD N-terminal domain-containing protein [Bryobacterales bacterium]